MVKVNSRIGRGSRFGRFWSVVKDAQSVKGLSLGL